MATTVPQTAPTLQANPTQGAPGQSVVLTGAGYAANDPVTATFNTTVVLATLTANANGTFSVTVRIPTDATPGGHTFVATGASGRSASTPFTVVIPTSTTRPAVVASTPLARTGSSTRGPLALAAFALMVGSAALVWSARRHTL